MYCANVASDYAEVDQTLASTQWPGHGDRRCGQLAHKEIIREIDLAMTTQHT